MVKKKKELLIEEEKRKSQAVTPRTQSIVARLMGLEGLHDEISSPCLTCYESVSAVSFSAPFFIENMESSKEKKKKTTKKKQSKQESKKDYPSPRRSLRSLNSNISGSISLPETPRASSEKPRDTDPRHSLQHKKENSCGYTMQELTFLREVMPVSSTLRKSRKDYFQYQDENRSPKSHNFTRDTAKQMKSNIDKRDGSFEINDDVDGIRLARKSKHTGKKYIKINQLQPPIVLKTQPTCLTPIAGFSESIKRVHQHLSPASLPSPSSINLFKSRVKPHAKTMKMEPGKCRKTYSYERFTEKVKRQPTQLTAFGQQIGYLQPAKKEQEPVC